MVCQSVEQGAGQALGGEDLIYGSVKRATHALHRLCNCGIYKLWQHNCGDGEQEGISHSLA